MTSKLDETQNNQWSQLKMEILSEDSDVQARMLKHS